MIKTVKKMRWVSILLVATFFTSFFPAIQGAQAVEPSSLQAKYDTLDNAGGNWYQTLTNDSGGLAWNESYVMNSYVVMYEATKNTKYLDKLATHATSVLKMRDSVRKVTDYRGLSLPAWRAAGGYTIGGKPYIFAVHTGMISYPMAEFARIVYKNPALWPKYKAQADIFLKASKDAVAVHNDEWRQSGDTGWYIIRKGAPEKTDGVVLPFNQLLAIARTQLAIWQATGEPVYYDRVKRMTQLFKNNLTSDSTGAYQWHYTWGNGYYGWTAADGISVNLPNFSGYKAWEDVSHGSIDVDFAVLAYDAGIVFTNDDMKKFGLTVEKKMLRSDGQVAYTVLGTTVSPSASHVARWLRVSKWAPSLFNYVSKLSLSGPTGLLSIAKLNQANLEKLGLYKPTDPKPPGTVPNPDPVPVPDPDPVPIPDPDPVPVPDPDPDPDPIPVPDTEAPTVKLEQPANGVILKEVSLLQASAADNTSVGQVYFEYTTDGQSWLKLGEGNENTGKWSLTLDTTTLADGSYGIRSLALDLEGNTGYSDVVNATIDNTKPSIESVISINSLLRATALLKVKASDNLGMAQVAFQYSQSSTGPWKTIGNGVQTNDGWTVQWNTVTLTDGAYYVKAVATDKAGNVSDGENILVNLDNTNPVVSQLTLTPDKIIADGTAKTTLAYQLSENANVKVFIINSAGMPVRTLFQGSQAAAGLQTMTWDGKNDNGNLNQLGTYTFKVEATDLAGNLGLTGQTNLIILEPLRSEAVINGSFTDGKTGWSSGGTIKTETNGNKFIAANYSFGLYQDLELKPGSQYKLNVKTRKGTAATEARIGIIFLNAAGKPISSQVIKYDHKGTGWESFPITDLAVPAGTVTTRLYLLVNGGTGTHDFDDISVKVFEPLVVNGDFSQGLTGWNTGGTLKSETNGNKYVSAAYGWQLYQDIKLSPGKQYKLNALTRKGSAQSEARIGIIFLDASGKIVSDQIIKYAHKGTGWESMSSQNFTFPAGAVTMRLYLLINGGTGYNDFDNINVVQL